MTVHLGTRCTSHFPMNLLGCFSHSMRRHWRQQYHKSTIFHAHVGMENLGRLLPRIIYSFWGGHGGFSLKSTRLRPQRAFCVGVGEWGTSPCLKALFYTIICKTLDETKHASKTTKTALTRPPQCTHYRCSLFFQIVLGLQS